MSQLAEKLTDRMRMRWQTCTGVAHVNGGFVHCERCSLDGKIIDLVAAVDRLNDAINENKGVIPLNDLRGAFFALAAKLSTN